MAKTCVGERRGKRGGRARTAFDLKERIDLSKQKAADPLSKALCTKLMWNCCIKHTGETAQLNCEQEFFRRTMFYVIYIFLT